VNGYFLRNRFVLGSPLFVLDPATEDGHRDLFLETVSEKQTRPPLFPNDDPTAPTDISDLSDSSIWEDENSSDDGEDMDFLSEDDNNVRIFPMLPLFPHPSLSLHITRSKLGIESSFIDLGKVLRFLFIG